MNLLILNLFDDAFELSLIFDGTLLVVGLECHFEIIVSYLEFLGNTCFQFVECLGTYEVIDSVEVCFEFIVLFLLDLVDSIISVLLLIFNSLNCSFSLCSI